MAPGLNRRAPAHRDLPALEPRADRGLEMIMIPRLNLIPILAAVAAAFVLAGCAAPELKQAQALVQSGQHEAALAKLQQGTQAHPDDPDLRAAYIKQRDTTVSYLLYQAEAARSAGRHDEVRDLIARIEATAPGHPRAARLRDEMARNERHLRLMAEVKAAMDKRRLAEA